MQQPHKKFNIGHLLPWISFLIVMGPATFQLVDAIQKFSDAYHEAQKRLLIWQVEQGLKLNKIADAQSVMTSVMAQPPPQQPNYDDRFAELLEHVQKIEATQKSEWEKQKPKPAEQPAEQKAVKTQTTAQPKTVQPQAAGDCANGTCYPTQQYYTYPSYPSRGWGLFRR